MTAPLSFEVTVDSEVFDALLIKEIQRHLQWSEESYDKAQEGSLDGIYSWTDRELEMKELKKDIKAYKRILKLFGGQS